MSTQKRLREAEERHRIYIFGSSAMMIIWTVILILCLVFGFNVAESLLFIGMATVILWIWIAYSNIYRNVYKDF